MQHINRVSIQGYVGRKPVIKETKYGNQLMIFSVGVNRAWKVGKEEKWENETSWFDVVVYNQAIIKTAKKLIVPGKSVFIEGELKRCKWKTKQGMEKNTIQIDLKKSAAILKPLETKTKKWLESSVAERFDFFSF